MSQEVARDRKRLKLRFETACDFVATVEGMRAEEIFGTIIPYHTWLSDNLASTGPVNPRRFVAWMESADRQAMDIPERGIVLFELLDETVIEAVRDENMQPAEVVEIFGEWVEESKRELIEVHGAPEDFFEVADGCDSQ